jgi:hypothetical protein
MIRPALAVLALTVSAGAAAAEPCSEPAYRQLDFWLGEWTITMDGKPMGTNTVSPVAGGCGLQEKTVGPDGWNGVSLLRYDPRDGAWHQSWVDSKGTLLELSGKARDGGGIIFTGETLGKDGGRALQRVTYVEDRAKKTLRQTHEVSRDAGKTWKIAFDGLFTQKK